MKNRSTFFLLIWTLLTLCIGTFLIYQTKQYHHYSETIGLITGSEEKQTESVIDEHQNEDSLTTQILTLTILNGPHKNKRITLQNNYSLSQIKDQHYYIGDTVFLHLNEERTHIPLEGTIIEAKRDTLLVIILTLFIFLLGIIGGTVGARSLLGFAMNGCLLITLLVVYQSINSHLLLIAFIILIPFLVTISLSLSNGWNDKTKIAIKATFIGTLFAFSLGFIVIESLAHKGLHYEEMELITRPPHTIFLSSLLVGCLGAVMDVSMTISSALYEIKQKKPTISKQDLKKAGTLIGQDIMGPMTNIMFFSYLSGTIPLILIFLRNNMSLTYTFSIVLSLEFARALVGSIGIIMAVPITTTVAVHYLDKKEVSHVS